MLTKITSQSYSIPQIKRENFSRAEVSSADAVNTQRSTFGLKMFETMDEVSYQAFQQATDGMDDLQKLSLAAGMEIRAMNAHVNSMYDYNTDPEGWKNAFFNMKSKGYDMSQTEPLSFLQNLSEMSKNIPDGNTMLVEILDKMVANISNSRQKIDTYA